MLVPPVGQVKISSTRGRVLDMIWYGINDKKQTEAAEDSNSHR